MQHVPKSTFSSGKLMIDKFLTYIKDKKLIYFNQPTLLAVSGGKDSMVMTDLFMKSGLPFGIGHIQHHLRGEESEKDALFVEDFAKQWNIPFFRHDIDPEIFAIGNMHDTARSIRYQWLNEWAHSKGYGQIAAAHHKDDWRETFLIHLLRGSGLEGLSSIQPKNQNIIRPLLWASREDIDTYAATLQIPYREDSSNTKDDYLRNHIRHHVVPALRNADERSFKGLDISIHRIKESSELLEFLIEKYKKDCISIQNEATVIDLQKIKNTGVDAALLYALIQDFGYNAGQTSDILNADQGSVFMTSHFIATVHQDQLHIKVRSSTETIHNVIFHDINDLLRHDGSLAFIMVQNEVFTKFDPNCLYLDIEKISFPVTLRSRKAGDRYKPLGLNGKTQKVKDLLINRKLSIFEKNEVMILEDSEKIIAITILAISDDVKISEGTQSILRISAFKD